MEWASMAGASMTASATGSATTGVAVSITRSGIATSGVRGAVPRSPSLGASGAPTASPNGADAGAWTGAGRDKRSTSSRDRQMLAPPNPSGLRRSAGSESVVVSGISPDCSLPPQCDDSIKVTQTSPAAGFGGGAGNSDPTMETMTGASSSMSSSLLRLRRAVLL